MRVLSIIAVICVVVTSTAYGGESKRTFCKKISEVASDTMLHRQENKPMSQLVELTYEHFPERMQPFILEIITNAYETEHFHTDEFRQKAISDFENLYYRECMSRR